MAAPADPLARYAPGHRVQVRAQARRLAQLLAAALPPTERGGWSGAQWEDAYYEAILLECAPRACPAGPESRPEPPRGRP